MEYKRLTDKDITKVCFDTWELCGLDNVCKRDCREPEPCKIPQIIHRLAELEDKIENGTLVELTCKVGDTIYEVFKNHKPPFIQQTKVEKIIITEKGLKLKLARNSVYETSIASLGKTLFLTEAEALKNIKS
jgi:hypothetical protein